MAIAADFEIQADKDIRHVSGTATYTVLELHRWLQGLADDATASGDDLMDITYQTPSERSTDNIVTLINGYNIDDTAAQYLYDGSITQTSGDVIYAGLVVVGSLASGNLEIIQNNTNITDTWSTHLNADATQNIIMRALIKVRTGGADTDGRRLRVQSRTFGYTYDEFSINGTSLGNNVAAISTTTDLNNQTASGTVGAWTITNTEGYQGIDIDANGANEFYYSKWDPGTQSINDTYEYAKYIQRDGTAATIHGMNGSLFRGITHQFAYSSEASGPFVEDATVSWGTGATAGTGIILALLDSGTTGTIWIQHLTGAAPVAALTATSGATTATIGTVTARTVSKPSFLGQSTGSAIIGAFGVGFVAAELSASDTVTDLSANTVTPPNNVTFTVSGLVSGEDRVLVASWDGATVDGDGNPVPDFDQFATSGTLNGAAVTAVVISTAIPADTPSSGVIRVVNNSGYHIRLPYSSWATSTFTLTSSYNFSGSGVNAAVTSGNNCYLGYIDTLAGATTASFTGVYTADRNLVVRVRDGASTPIKTFVTSAVLGSAGGSSTAIRTTDA